MESAEGDIDVLQRLDADGDDFSQFREVDFHFKCPTAEKAELVADFINDFNFGNAEAVETDDAHFVNVVITMPASYAKYH